MRVCVRVCASDLYFNAWPACKKLQKEISVCVISCFMNTLPGLKDSCD